MYPRSDRSTLTANESQLFWLQEYLQLEPHARIKMAQVLGSLVYICGCEQIKAAKVAVLPESTRVNQSFCGLCWK